MNALIKDVYSTSLGKGASWTAGFYMLAAMFRFFGRTLEVGLFRSDMILFATACIFLVTMLLTRLSFTRRSIFPGAVPFIPYWIPVVGNIPGLIVTGIDQFLTQLR